MADIGPIDNDVVVNPTVTTTGYLAGQCIGGLQTFTAFRGETNAAGFVQDFLIASKSGQAAGINIVIFDANPSASTFTDRATAVVAAADVSKLAFNAFTVTTAVSQGVSAAVADVAIVRSVQNHDTRLTTANLYVGLVATSTITCTTVTDIMFKIGLRQD